MARRRESRRPETADNVFQGSDEEFRLLIENAPDLISVLDCSATFRYASPSSERVLGYKPEELIGRNALDFVHPQDAGGMRTALTTAIRGPGAAFFVEFRFRGKDGSWRFIEAVGNTLLDASGSAQVLISSRDVTDRKSAEATQQQEAQISAALARVGQELMAALDTPLLVDRLCRVSAEVLGCDYSYILLSQAEEGAFGPVLGSDGPAQEREAARVMKVPPAMMSALFSRLESDDVTQVGTIPHLLLVPEHERLGVTHSLCMALRRGMNLIGVQVVLSRGGRKLFTETQRRIARGIAQVASRALEHERVVKQLGLSSRLKSEFVATMSHEIRTPLSVITGYVDLMLDGTFGALKAVQVETLQKVQKSSLELLGLINATLDLGRLEAGRVPLEMQEIGIASLLDELDGETRELQEQSGLRFVWNAPRHLPRVLADAAKLKVVLKNLIGNAAKFTQAGTVMVQAHAGDEGVEVSITDTGIGIAAEALPIIFEPFRQADSSSTQRQSGVGLGLYIVRRLLDMMGGSVTVDTEVGRGSTFRVLLPALQP